MTDDILDEVRQEREQEQSEAEPRDIPAPFGDYEGHRVGHITAQDEPIIIDREDSHIRAFIDSTYRDDVRLGNYLRIPYPVNEDQDEELLTSMLVGVINRLEYATVANITDKQDGGYRHEPGEQSFSYVAEI
jgi:hypothetical protein